MRLRVTAPCAAAAVVALAFQALLSPVSATGPLRVTWEPPQPRAGDVARVRIEGAPAAARIDAQLDGRPLHVYPTGASHAALVGIDMDAPAGTLAWQVSVAEDPSLAASGELPVVARSYSVQHLAVAPGMAELDPETEKRAVMELERMRALYRLVSGERLWAGPWARPVAGDRPGTGFGARRVINGKPRAPHSGIDFPAAVGTSVVAANRGRVALVGDFFFPGRLVILDHGLGLYTLYFHLDTIGVREGELLERGQSLGTVGMTGRVTGPHLHFGAQIGASRIDPAVLLELGEDRP
jgi:murein DD-endopeptidase MepM/ murein hydrolase activator NlpD